MILGITGHRPQNLKNVNLNKLTKAIEIKIKKLNPKQILTGMALGVDQILAEICIQQNIDFTACIPCDDQDKLWNNKEKEHYAELLSSAKNIINVSIGPYTAYKMLKRNEYIVDNCNELLAIWDQKESGGTYSTVKYAKENGRLTHIINPRNYV